MPNRTRDYRESLLEDLQDQNEAAAYLSAALEDSQSMFLVALRDVAAAAQMTKVAEDAGVTREAAYRMLSKSGNPRLSSLCGLLRALGLVMYFRPAAPSSSAAASTQRLSHDCSRYLFAPVAKPAPVQSPAQPQASTPGAQGDT